MERQSEQISVCIRIRRVVASFPLNICQATPQSLGNFLTLAQSWENVIFLESRDLILIIED